MVSETRAQRVARRIREELADLLRREVEDPRLRLVTVTDVEVDRELAFATVYVAAPQPERKEEILRALEGAGGFLRSQLASRIRLRVFPRLRFRWDDSPDRGAHIEELLKALREQGGGSSVEGMGEG